MAILSTAKIVGMLASAKKTGRQVMNAAGEYVAEIVEDFMSGFAGYGWKIWEYVKGKWMFEIDSIRVREQFIAFEMLVSKMRAIIGSLGISQACGKIATVTLSEDGAEYLITLEDETMSFVAHDFMRCQIYTGTKQSLYHVEISSVANGVIHVPVSEFDKDAKGIVTNPPEAGNDIVQFGNSVSRNRQSAIYIHADESGQPAIDIMFDIDSKDWTGKVKLRLGGDIPGGDGTRGFFCENGMIKGTDTSGHTVYCIYPDGTAEFGDGSAKFNTDKSGFIAGGAISWKWDSSKNKYVCTMKDVILQWENLGNVPDWITEWDTNKVQIGGSYMISPKLFTGKNTGTAEEPVLTGILQGDKCITIDGIERSGIFALVNNEVVFELDPENGKYKFKGEIHANVMYLNMYRGVADAEKPGGSICIGYNIGVLPEIPSGMCRNIKWIVPLLTRVLLPATVTTSSDKVRIAVDGNVVNSVASIEFSDVGLCAFDLYGWRESDSDMTYWGLYPSNDNAKTAIKNAQ